MIEPSAPSGLSAEAKYIHTASWGRARSRNSGDRVSQQLPEEEVDLEAQPSTYGVLPPPRSPGRAASRRKKKENKKRQTFPAIALLSTRGHSCILATDVNLYMHAVEINLAHNPQPSSSHANFRPKGLVESCNFRPSRRTCSTGPVVSPYPPWQCSRIEAAGPLACEN